MKKWLLMLALSMLAVVLVACGDDDTSDSSSSSSGVESDSGTSAGSGETASEGETYKFKLGHEAAESHIKFEVAEKFSEELEKNSDGRMTVDIYPANQLGKEADMAQQVESGTLDFAILSNGTVSSLSESINGWFMPFLFNDLQSAADAASTEPAQQMLKDLEVKNMHGYGVFFAGQRHILSSKPIGTVEDLKGLKIRIPGSPVFESYYKAIGAGPASMPLPEVYTSLSTGVIDAVDTDFNAAVSQKFYESANILTLSGHIVFPEVVLGAKKTIDSMSEEDRQIVADTWASVIEWGVKESIASNDELLKELKSLGVKVNELSNVDEFKQLSAPVYDQYSSNPTIKAFIDANK
ncbi:C4-dicarboxylate ABC transporter substrate-binding protein [Lysinibacillus sp. 2017]|uniref:TRAP transporter substrate-binding protein n=1 Tax=unclassified Lysinibacillus TaxID=2636778 RepID=UPI000D5272EB|nr:MULTISPECIES: TRAP transporter substrate-binding protein [unclassified Lysinibacillus]AWE06162.1 C4-dicarboxylate ABC transporter substrate-binding protein [Lysinibacillus sp. 2017]TGN35183.1 TRAP transporter substrate-binding protein [Lysinibacillus sp. S2017]